MVDDNAALKAAVEKCMAAAFCCTKMEENETENQGIEGENNASN